MANTQNKKTNRDEWAMNSYSDNMLGRNNWYTDWTKNDTPLLQPMDHNVMQKVKTVYNNKLLTHIISQSGVMPHSVKELNLKEESLVEI